MSQPDHSTDLARRILDLNFPEFVHRRCEELSYKVQEGALTPDETRELDGYLDMDKFLTILKARARVILRDAGDSPRGSEG